MKMTATATTSSARKGGKMIARTLAQKFPDDLEALSDAVLQ